MSFEASTSLLSRVDGSAQLQQGPIKVMASVTGPIEAKPRQELPRMAALEIVVRPTVGVSSTREKLLEDKLRSLFQSVIVAHKYPRQLIQIVVQFLTNDQDFSSETNTKDFTSNELSSAINCCFLALVDANIALNCSFASVSLSIPNNSHDILVAPSAKDLLTSASHHVVAYSIKDQQIDNLLMVESFGSFTQDQLFSILDEAAIKCQHLHTTYERKAIIEKVSRDYVWKY